MHVLVFSDTHLTHRFNPQLFALLQKQIRLAKSVIINGDFWDAYRSNFHRFIGSPWRNLFPDLLSRDAIYIYGNHDRCKYSDQRVNLFSKIQTESLKTNIAGRQFHFEHGNTKALKIDKHIPLFISKIISPATMGIIRQFYYLTGHTVPINFNHKIKRELNNTRDEKQAWYVCGHSHIAEIDTDINFANSGCMIYPEVSYLTISTTTGDIQLHRDRL